VSKVVLVGLVVLVTLISVPLFGGDARSAYDDSQLIAFTRPDGIYVIRVDGRGERPLRRGSVAAGAVGLAWSPDGRKLAFSNWSTGIWVMNADGSGLMRLLAPAEISAKGLGEPSWSPLGRRIAFTALRDKGRWDIWVVNADGTNAHRLLRAPRPGLYQVDWSPFGNRFALTELGWFLRVYVMKTNGTHLRAINPGSMFEAAMPHWSPQGYKIAFMGWPAGPSMSDAESLMQEAEVWVLDVNQDHAQRLTHNTVIDSNPAWSPDGSRIVFLRGHELRTLFVGAPEKSSRGEIYVMNADGTGVTRLTHNGVGEGSPAWQPVSMP
jgi:TolB protein